MEEHSSIFGSLQNIVMVVSNDRQQASALQNYASSLLYVGDEGQYCCVLAYGVQSEWYIHTRPHSFTH